MSKTLFKNGGDVIILLSTLKVALLASFYVCGKIFF